MIEKDTRAAKSFYREVRKFAESTNPWDTTAIFYETKPDEAFDRRDEFLAVMAAAGLDTVDQPLPQKRIVLPNEGQLYAIKRRTGFESIPGYREDYAPTWAEG